MSSSDIFEIVDHTSASGWEKFISSIEDLLESWQQQQQRSPTEETIHTTASAQEEPNSPAIGNLDDGNAYPPAVYEIVSFEEQSYILSLHRLGSSSALDTAEERAAMAGYGGDTAAQQQQRDETPEKIKRDLAEQAEDFRKDCHFLHRWFGVREFLLLSPVTDSASVSLSDAKLLLSSLCIAAQNLRSSIAVFVPFDRLSDQLYMGYMVEDGVEVRLHTSKLTYVPRSYAHLSGLADFFSSKLDPTRPLKILNSACFTFKLRNWYDEEWKDPISLQGSGLSVNDFSMLTFGFGPNIDPLECFQLGAYWPEFPQDAVLDNAVYSELDPSEAPLWTLTRSFRAKFNHTLTETLFKVINTYMVSNGVDFASEKFDPESFSGAKVMEAVGTTINTVVRKNNNLQPPNYVQELLRVLFSPQKEARGAFYDAPLLKALNLPTSDQTSPYFGKVSPRGSLAWLIALHVSNEIHDPEMKSLASLWNEIVREIRLHFENGKFLGRTEQEAPNLKYNLLHQKFQMINFCIKKKREVEGLQAPEAKNFKALFGSGESDEAEEDVFYDTTDDIQTEEGIRKKTGSVSSMSSLGDLEGREGQIKAMGEKVFCLNGRLLYIPETQDPAPLTEDVLEEQQKVFEEMGTSNEAAVIRQKLQSAQLRSDMEAFKAANPGSVLEDFVRWHSPRDWIAPVGEAKATISGRMQEEGNLWIETWKVSEAVAARRQKPLFNYNQEAMKVLHYLENMTVDSLIEQILPNLFLLAYDSFLSCGASIKLKPLPSLLSQLQAKIVQFPWGDLRSRDDDLRDLLRLVKEIEYYLTLAKSLYHKFPGQNDLIERLLTKESTILVLQQEREEVKQLFLDRDGDFAFSSPESREFILRTVTPNPHPSSRSVVHRLYALLTENEFRVAEAFSFDVEYY